jgi:hypothetical protein
MNIKDRFSDNYLRADDITKPVILTITSVDEVTIGDDDRVVLEFEDYVKVLPLNKTNALNLADLFGDDTDDWIGHTIELYRDNVMFQGKRTAAVRVRAPREQRPRKQIVDPREAKPQF